MRWLLWPLVMLVLLLIPAISILAALTLQPSPSVTSATAPTRADINTAKSVLNRFRAATSPLDGGREITLTEGEISSLLRLGERAIPGARAAAQTSDGSVHLDASLPLRVLDGGPWINVSVTAPDFDDGVTLSAVQVGQLDIPPDFARYLGIRLADLWLGKGSGAELIEAFPSLHTRAGQSTLGMSVTADRRGDLARTLLSAFRGSDMPSGPEVDAYRQNLFEAFRDGTLQPSGSFTDHLTFLLKEAYANGAAGDLGREYTAAVFALTRACGSEHIRPYLGKLVPEGGLLDDAPIPPSVCGNAGLHDRVDLRRHFITAATLRAASNRGVAISIGEFKELSDMGGSSGFDFTDIVANNSGIRLSDRMMSASAAEWPMILDMLSDEAKVIATLDGIPGAMSQAAFETTYTDVQSAEYFAVLNRIEARIDALAVHRP